MKGFSTSGLAGILMTAMLPATVCPAFEAPAQQHLPYVAVHDPQFIPASQAVFMGDSDRVIGVMSGKVAKAYPAGILSQHGLVQDQTLDGSIAVTW